MESTWGHRGDMFGPYEAILDALGAILGSTGAILDTLWATLGAKTCANNVNMRFSKNTNFPFGFQSNGTIWGPCDVNCMT